ncbi:acylphosphatase [Paracoccus sp. JM45]|uniref:acylphosphatase n=1 Tax=Paracoccus sp. JM45 TaxID=2283626 RepID=UPI000E6C1EE7|nr:acylphosphatase [Paracoccus sp. JM45]RJE79134.1 acylphosphatase [Paracoccus sp. JM45]
MASERFIISGQLGNTLDLWIRAHARRIGVCVDIGAFDQAVLEMGVVGPSEMRDAMEMGCLLGPIDAWIENIQREAL